MIRSHTFFRSFLTIWVIAVTAILAHAEATPMTALGIDVPNILDEGA